MMLSKLVEIASVFVCFYHISSRIVNANHLIVREDERLTRFATAISDWRRTNLRSVPRARSSVVIHGLFYGLKIFECKSRNSVQRTAKAE
jgi:hypothetical protein